MPSNIFHVTLSKKPALIASEIIEGYIEFESRQFYQKASTPGQLMEMQFDLKGYFKTYDLKHSAGGKGGPKWMVQ